MTRILRLFATLRSQREPFIRFAVVGTFGFLVDATALTVALDHGAGLYLGRAISFLTAATTTWYLNRKITFESRDLRIFREWLRFLLANAVGGLANFVVYAALVAFVSVFAHHPILAVAAGSVTGLTLNYLLSKRIVFANKAT